MKQHFLIAAEQRDAADDLMATAAEHPQHARGIRLIRRLAQHQSIDGDKRISADDDALRMPAGDRHRLFLRQLLDRLRDGQRFIQMFFDLRRLYAKAQSDLLQQLLAAGRLAGQYDLFHPHFLLRSLSDQRGSRACSCFALIDRPDHA